MSSRIWERKQNTDGVLPRSGLKYIRYPVNDHETGDLRLMRRKDREVTDSQKIREIILSCRCCRLGFYDNGEVYIVPLDFGYYEKNGRRVFYFHGAKEGRKYRLTEKSPTVGFELDTNQQLVRGKKACEYTSRYQSVIGTGRVTILKRERDKIEALKSILHHSTGKKDWDFSSRELDKVAVFQLEVESLSCKECR